MKWHCRVCDYVHEGQEPPGECPVCGVGRYAFDLIEEADPVESSSDETPSKEVITRKTVDEILKQAVAREQEAYDIYTEAMEAIKDPGAKKLIGELASEELGHVRKLEKFKTSGLQQVEMKKIQDLRISDYLVDKALAPEMHLQDVLIFAMKREKEAHEFYLNLSKITDDAEAKRLFDFLAVEELSHKNKLERFYDDVVYKED